MKTMFLTAMLFCVPIMADDDPIPASKFTPRGHTTDEVAVVRNRVESQAAVLLDVREQEEWEAGHLKRAKLVPLSVVKSGKFSKEMKKHLPKDKPIYVHCRSGGRVLAVSTLLRARGYDIRPLQDGYTQLLTKGFEKAEEEKK